MFKVENQQWRCAKIGCGAAGRGAEAEVLHGHRLALQAGGSSCSLLYSEGFEVFGKMNTNKINHKMLI